jgi:hypothetical protein
MVEDKGMMRVPALRSAGYRNFPQAPGTPSFLQQQDKPPHLANRGMFFAPVY